MRIRFDKGTVLIDDESGEYGEDILKLPGMLRDPRVKAFRAPAWRYPMIMAALKSLGHSMRDEVRRSGPRPGPFSPIELRPYQDAALEAWELAGRRGILALPTGSGKTRTALAAMARAGQSALCFRDSRGDETAVPLTEIASFRLSGLLRKRLKVQAEVARTACVQRRCSSHAQRPEGGDELGTSAVAETAAKRFVAERVFSFQYAVFSCSEPE